MIANRFRLLALPALLLLFLAANFAPATAQADEPAAPPAAAAPTAEAAAPAAADTTAAAPAEGKVSFARDIAPVLLKQCLACHGQQEPKSDYQLQTFALLTKAGASGSAPVTPGKPDESLLYMLIAESDPDARMPKEADPLPAEQIALVRRWIEEGAPYDGNDPQAPLASIVPKAAHPDPPAQYRVPVPVAALAISPDGTELAVGGYREVTIWNPADGSLLRRIKNVAERTYGLAYHPAGGLLAVASGVPGQLGEIRLYDSAQGTLAKDLASMTDVAYDVSFSPDGTRLAAAGGDRSIRIFEVATGAQQRLIEDHADWVLSVRWNHDATRIVSASRDKTSKVFDTSNGEAQVTYSGHGQTVFSAVFSPDGSQVFSGGGDEKVHLWNVADAAKVAEITGYGHEVYRLLVRPAGLFSCSSDKTVRQHSLDKRELIRTFSGHNDWVFSIDVHEPTARLASGGYDGEVRLWNLADGASTITFRAAPGWKPAP